MKMSNQVRVIDSLSKTILFETTMDKISDAYSYATQMEEMGLDIEVIAPGLAETLIQSLGATSEEIDEYKQRLQDEIDEHDDSDFGCAVCFTPHK
jgi:hypothetical protein